MARARRFAATLPIEIPSGHLTSLRLSPDGDLGESVESTESGGVCFLKSGWFEVLLAVQWDPESIDGSRFTHTATTGTHPLHSEAISASVLAAVSGGRQLLRRSERCGPGGVEEISLEVWQDSSAPVFVREAELVVRKVESP